MQVPYDPNNLKQFESVCGGTEQSKFKRLSSFFKDLHQCAESDSKSLNELMTSMTESTEKTMSMGEMLTIEPAQIAPNTYDSDKRKKYRISGWRVLGHMLNEMCLTLKYRDEYLDDWLYSLKIADMIDPRHKALATTLYQFSAGCEDPVTQMKIREAMKDVGFHENWLEKIPGDVKTAWGADKSQASPVSLAVHNHRVGAIAAMLIASHSDSQEAMAKHIAERCFADTPGGGPVFAACHYDSDNAWNFIQKIQDIDINSANLMYFSLMQKVCKSGEFYKDAEVKDEIFQKVLSRLPPNYEDWLQSNPEKYALSVEMSMHSLHPKLLDMHLDDILALQEKNDDCMTKIILKTFQGKYSCMTPQNFGKGIERILEAFKDKSSSENFLASRSLAMLALNGAEKSIPYMIEIVSRGLAIPGNPDNIASEFSHLKKCNKEDEWTDFSRSLQSACNAKSILNEIQGLYPSDRPKI